MALYKLNSVVSRPDEFASLKSEIESHLAIGKKYNANFYLNRPLDEIVENEGNIIVNAEYGAIAEILVSLTKLYPNFKYGEYDKGNMHIVKWTVISEDTSQ